MQPSSRPTADKLGDVSDRSAAIAHSFDSDMLAIGVPLLQTSLDGDSALLAAKPLMCQTLPVDGPAPFVASMEIGKPSVKTVGCVLPEGRTLLAKQSMPTGLSSEISAAKNLTPGRVAAPRQKHTRIRPPKDVVRLEDRLQYLLQPPLEALLESESLRFPFHPFPYQLDGVAFLFPRRHAVLADEMGLGKTMQSITTVRLLAQSGQISRVLLVCPKPLVTNWVRELALWAPDVSVVTIEGNQQKREWLWRNSTAVVTIANYESALRDEAILHDPDLRFDLLMLDEAQRVKNTQGATSQVIRGIQRDRSWALTGTPIENSADDLVGLFEFVSPGLLHTGMKPRAMGKAVQDVVLRRTKEKVLDDLPPKIMRDAEIDLTAEQWETYRRAEDDGIVSLNDLGAELTVHHVFELVLRLKQICNFDPVTGASSKAERLEADLEECVASGRKAIVFSQWVKTLDQITERISRFNPVAYHGRIPHAQRDGVIDHFRNDPDCHVILMSYGAGSVGLNLQFAGYVFLFDRWWNPAVEDQAINRAHRIGAAGSVTVSRFLASGTIEQRIDQVLREKRELFDTVFEESTGPQSYGLSRQELLSLFNLQSPQGRVADAA